MKAHASLEFSFTQLLKKNAILYCSLAQEKSLRPKIALTNVPILVFPDLIRPFILYTDAFPVGIILVQFLCNLTKDVKIKLLLTLIVCLTKLAIL